MQSDGLVETWSDRCLVAGQPWDKIIRREMEEADVIVFLVSYEFLATDYVRDVELVTALKRAAAGEAVVASVILEECPWQKFEVEIDNQKRKLAAYQVLPHKAKPVRDTKPQRNAWHAVAEGLRQVLDELKAKHAGAGEGRHPR